MPAIALSFPTVVLGSAVAALSGPSSPPVAMDDAYSLDEDETLSVPRPGVLTNDSGDGPLQALLVAEPANGTLTLHSDGSFTYKPSKDYFGTDVAVYKVSDGLLESIPAAITFTVRPLNDEPTAVPDLYDCPHGAPLFVPAPGVLANDRDPDGEPLSAQLEEPPRHGSVRLNADGSFEYEPFEDAESDGFSYVAKDRASYSDPARVSIRVAPAPGTPATKNPQTGGHDPEHRSPGASPP